MARRRTGPTAVVKALVFDRDGGACVRCGALEALTVHHRVNRGMGGAREPWINQAHNLLTACTVCNGWFEDNPRESYEKGWKVRRPQLPGEVEVHYADGRRYILAPDGVRSTTVAAAR
ncbi:HNH endonuclease [Streptomyces sp. SP18BB07]|uniref:HNH endonuclease n=1 Tax=Streptomyces sp. SP18BB07 TaxID=3002522 RepID=UPI002E7985F2|nr:HNH endonuclease signature motif containing protein [Streptomyces sp. SP18BB07]MEE1764350.1 HNH endonuclease signature motif containing protein [Streptomyces sp. SP18BB07]